MKENWTLGFKKNISSLETLMINREVFSAAWPNFTILTHPTLRRRGEVVTTSFCMFQRRHSYVPNETPNDVSLELRQDVSVVRLHDVLLERPKNVSKGRNNDVPPVRLKDVSNKSQMKHPTTSLWYVFKTSQWYVSTTSH